MPIVSECLCNLVSTSTYLLKTNSGDYETPSSAKFIGIC